MAAVIYIKEGRSHGYITVGVVNEGARASYTIPIALYSSVGSPIRGQELCEEELELLDEANKGYLALKKALSLLSYSDNSERSLIMKLRRAGFSSDVSEQTVCEAVRLGYIDEERQLKRLILCEANERLSGRYRIIQRLTAKGYPSGKIKKITDELSESGELDFDKNRCMLLEKHLSKDAEADEKNKVLYKYGYITC